MTLPPGTRLEIGSLRISGASNLVMRQLADALPLALERALAGGGGATLADQVARRVVAGIARQQEAGQ